LPLRHLQERVGNRLAVLRKAAGIDAEHHRAGFRLESINPQP
jgi:hypothetical protein